MWIYRPTDCSASVQYHSCLIECVTCADYALLNASVCLPSPGQDDRQVSMRCAQGHMVKLVRLVYGHSSSSCHYRPGDCVTYLVASGNEVTCVGLDRCDVPVTSRHHGRPIPGCQLPTTYFHASFQCIPGTGHTVWGPLHFRAGWCMPSP